MASNIEETMIAKSDIDLVQMLFVEKEKYTKESIELAKKEYTKRNIPDEKKENIIKSLEKEEVKTKEGKSKKHQEIVFIIVGTLFYTITIRFDWFNNLSMFGRVAVAGLIGALSSLVVSMVFTQPGQKSEKYEENGDGSDAF